MTSPIEPTTPGEERAPGAAPPGGLTTEEVLRLRAVHGRNAIEAEHESALHRLARFFWGPIPWMIEAACVLSAIARRWDDLILVSSMLLIHAAVGFFEEHKAHSAIEALQRRLAPRARVRRDGQWQDVDAAELVPGDLVLVRLGNIVPADLRLSGEGAIDVDQSALTGESLPVTKSAGEEAYSGTIARLGEMEGTVTAIGAATRFGKTMTSCATFRVAGTIRLLLFMSLSILVFGSCPVTVLMIVLLAVLDDLPIMTIAYDDVRVAPGPVRWDMRRALTLSAVLGTVGLAESFGLFWIVRVLVGLPEEIVRTLLFLELLVAGHLTIYVTRNDGALWQRPLPSWKLVAATGTTQLVGTLVAVFGWLVEPVGWVWAAAIWAYCLVWVGIESAVKIGTLKLLERGTASHRRHPDRVSARLSPQGR